MRLLGLDPGLRHTGWGVIEALSPSAIAVARSPGRSTERIASAALAPTPCTDWRSRNQTRSAGSRKPKSVIASSRTWVSTCSSTGWPVRGSRCSVLAAQCTR